MTTGERGSAAALRFDYRWWPACTVALLLLVVGCGGGGGSTSVPVTGTPGGASGPAAPASEAPTPNVEAANLFANNCSGCHGGAGQGGIGPNLQESAKAGDLRAVIKQVRDGGGGMPSFQEKLTDEEIDLLAHYVVRAIHQ
jgi:mono/diheme cytochrome c family protein